MYTGIIDQIGTVTAINKAPGEVTHLQISADRSFLRDSKVGDSMAVNGCCLTVTACSDGITVDFNLSPETLNRTAPLTVGTKVHLEHPLKVGDRLGGHFVTGHVDGCAQVQKLIAVDNCIATTFSLPTNTNARLVVPQASVTLAGVSLTVSTTSGRNFTVQLIPHTMAVTRLNSTADLVVGAQCNFEADYLARFYSPSPC